MNRIILLMMGLLLSYMSFSQVGVINGRVIDSTSRKTLPLATVTVFKAIDTVLVTYRLSNQDGAFKVPGLPLNVPLRVMVTFSGYTAYRKDFILTAANSTIHFDSVIISSTASQLDEVIVFAERPPVIIKNDTIEFNAGAFKTLPNALVEDLLKKLPGVQVDADGNINVNGKAVNRILVDGKTFFGSDPKMASRNLPANIIDKVQVTDDKEELLRNGDDNVNNVGKVVNITLKKGVKKGWFGKAYAGGGSSQRFEAGGIANIFRDTLQVSVMGYTNNLNKPGFNYSDLMQTGGLERTGSNLASRSMSISNSGSGSGISINGINYGGAQSFGGISTSKGVGFNLNHAPNLKKSFYLQYFYGNILIDRQTTTDSKQYNADTVVDNNTLLTGGVVTNSHNIGVGTKLKPDSVTTIQANASYKIGLQDENRLSTIYSDNNKLGQVSYGNIIQDNKANSYSYSQNFSYTRLSKTKKGRRYSISHNLDINNRYSDYSTDAVTHFRYPYSYDSLLQQLRREGLPRTDLNVAFNYSEPLSKRFSLRVGGRYEYSKLNDKIQTFNPNNTDHEYNSINSSLSSNFNRESNRFYVNTGLEFKWKDLTITPSVRALYQQVNNNLALSDPIRETENNLLPGLGIVYKQLNFNYSKDVILPAYTYLIPVTNNTNPYFIVKGNADLVPAKRHNLSVNYNFNDQKRILNIWLSGGGSFTSNDVIQSISVDDKGIQTNFPVNANGSSESWLNYGINKQYRNKNNFILAWNFGAYYDYSRSKLLYNNEDSWQSIVYLNQWVGVNLNFNDKFEFNTNYGIGYNFTSYTSTIFSKLQVTTYNWNNEIIVRMPKYIIWENSINYAYNGNVTGSAKSIVRWNAAVNITMLKDEKGVLRLSVYDILNKNANINVNVNRNMITTTQNNVLPQYFMATFTYNIRAIGAPKKKVGGERLFLF